jgi:hypothetical protein
MRKAASCHSSTQITSEIYSPMPPAPTMPMIVADRVFAGAD